MDAEEEPVFVVVDAPTGGVQRVRPLMRNVGLVHVAAALVLGVALSLGAVQGCLGDDVQVLPSGITMAGLIGLTGVSMALRLPRATAVAPALAAGASLALLGSAAGWVWVVPRPCVGSGLNPDVVALLVTAASAAVLATSLWLLVSRHEIEPWHAARGVVAATAAALSVLVLGIGFGVLLVDTAETPVVVALTLAWAVAVAATGWLRPSPAIAVVTPAVLQAVWLLFG
jgi:hypothetical protein